jgi:hypothetical protein
MSGLVCNVEKTVLLPVGTNTPIDERIINLGFSISNKITILGAEIDCNGFTEQNFLNIKKKIVANVNAWKPFNLSLPGRINIAKSLLYSQINYLGCFLPIPDNILIVWDTLITDFVKGKLNIAKKRLYKTPEDGGLGLFDIRDFLDAQKCAWLKRSLNLNEPWKVRLYIGGFGNLFNTKSQNICGIEFPISYDLCKSFERVSNAFTTSNENYRRCYIFENPKITLHLESRATLSKSMFNADFLNNTLPGYTDCDIMISMMMMIT